MSNQQIDTEMLVRDYGLTISQFAHRMIKNPDVAKEAAQETWYELLRCLPSFRRQSNTSTWIYTIARRTLLRCAKNERVYTSTEITAHFEMDDIPYYGLPDEKKGWVKTQCDQCLTAFCHCLTNEARLIFIFRDIAELSYEEIANIMEMTLENVRKISSRSRKKVKNYMEKNCIFLNPPLNAAAVFKLTLNL
ncbi:RNA polymerase sigma factor [candidate division KSB1 bacterium]|nr:RNA polymerase sigma factor [candidate division KSB1 bacterium]